MLEVLWEDEWVYDVYLWISKCLHCHNAFQNNCNAVQLYEINKINYLSSLLCYGKRLFWCLLITGNLCIFAIHLKISIQHVASFGYYLLEGWIVIQYRTSRSSAIGRSIAYFARRKFVLQSYTCRRVFSFIFTLEGC